MLQNMFAHKRTLSFEVFPPKKDGDFESAFQVMDELGKLSPDFISVTYGAGGSRAGKTVEIASYIQNTLGIDAVAHVTCVGSCWAWRRASRSRTSAMCSPCAATGPRT